MNKKIKSIALLLGVTLSPALHPMREFLRPLGYWALHFGIYTQESLYEKQKLDQLTEDFIKAIRTDDMSKVKEFIKNGIDINRLHCFGTSPLIWAIRDNPGIVKFLIDHGADVNRTGSGQYSHCTPLIFALETYQYNHAGNNLSYANLCNIIKLLVEHGIDIHTSFRGNIYSAIDYWLDIYTPGRIRARTNDPEGMFQWLFFHYLYLADHYNTMHKTNNAEILLKDLNFEQQQNVLEMALTQNNSSDLEKFHTLNPKVYSWEYMLALAEQKDLYKPVAFLLAKLSVHPNKKTIKNVYEIMDDAKAHHKTNFGRAVRDFMIKKYRLQLNYIPVKRVLEGGITDSMPNELAYKIMEYME